MDTKLSMPLLTHMHMYITRIIGMVPQEGWPSGVWSRVHAWGPSFESWRVPCGGWVPSMHCASSVGSLRMLGWGLWHPGHSNYGSIQHFLAGGIPIRSCLKGKSHMVTPAPFLIIKKKKKRIIGMVKFWL